MRPFAIPMVRSAFFAAVAALSVLLPTDVGARGESCDINLPNGLKEPGKEDGNGNCCTGCAILFQGAGGCGFGDV